MRPKEMENLAIFSVREVKRAAAEERKSDEYSSEKNQQIPAAPINSRLNVVAGSRTPFGLGRSDCWPFGGSQLPRALPRTEGPRATRMLHWGSAPAKRLKTTALHTRFRERLFVAAARHLNSGCPS